MGNTLPCAKTKPLPQKGPTQSSPSKKIKKSNEGGQGGKVVNGKKSRNKKGKFHFEPSTQFKLFWGAKRNSQQTKEEVMKDISGLKQIVSI